VIDYHILTPLAYFGVPSMTGIAAASMPAENPLGFQFFEEKPLCSFSFGVFRKKNSFLFAIIHVTRG